MTITAEFLLEVLKKFNQKDEKQLLAVFREAIADITIDERIACAKIAKDKVLERLRFSDDMFIVSGTKPYVDSEVETAFEIEQAILARTKSENSPLNS